MKKVLHIISHSHWDREWYMSFEQHRMRLVELIDALIEKMEQDENYKFFHLDGQTILIDDYLEIRPQMKERLYKLINDGRIQVGPWYILQDEFLTSGEANIRNMTEGLRFCKENNIEPVMTGYMPDAFGNISQMPQLLKGFGIDNAVFGRGVYQMWTSEPLENSDRELIWNGADGTKVIGVMFSTWYDNANQLPTNEEDVKITYRKLIDTTSYDRHTPHLLAMNGSDHQPIQKNLPESIEKAKELFGNEVEIRHSNFKDFIKELRPYADTFKNVYGELTRQRTTGFRLLVNTASTHIPIKQKNHTVQSLLANQCEPISVMADSMGDAYRSEMLRYAWKKLIQCHPHDTICCCSCDDVIRELSVRLDKAGQSAGYVLEEAARFLGESVNTANFDWEHSLVLLHSSPKSSTELVNATLMLNEYTDVSQMSLCDANGKTVPGEITYIGECTTCTLPKNAFRKVENKHKYQVVFPAKLDGIGCQIYGVLTDKPVVKTDTGLILHENGAENSFVRLKIEQDGTLTLTDKKSGRIYPRLNYFEDVGDVGNTYNFLESDDCLKVYSNNDARCELVNYNGFSATFCITTTMDIPVGANNNQKRTNETITHTIKTKVCISAYSPRIDIKTTFTNQSENHRLRALFNNNIQTDTVMADVQFDLIKRQITPWSGWQNPSNCQRMQAFFGLEDSQGGLLVAARGLNEYEVLRDGSNTMALTLLRSVGVMGDVGTILTPDAQLKGKKIKLEYAIVPYATNERSQAFDLAYSFEYSSIVSVQTSRHQGVINKAKTFVSIKGDYIRFSALKKAENEDAYILRLYNISDEEQKAEIFIDSSICSQAFITNLAEDSENPITITDGVLKIEFAPKKIQTLKLKK